MDIKGSGHNYRIIRATLLNGDKDVYRCIEKSEDIWKAVTVFRLRNCKEDLLQYLPGLEENKRFTDFIEYFICEKDVYIVFTHAEGESLKKKLLQESIRLEERAKLGAHIIAELIQKEMPYYFACDGLQEENVKVTAYLEVYFEYNLWDVENAGNYEIKEVNGAVLKWIQLLFETEIKQKRSKRLQKFCKKLEKNKLTNYADIYLEYMETCEELRSLPEMEEEDTEEDPSFVERIGSFLWEKLKSFWVKGVNIFAVLFLVAVIALSVLYFNYRQEKNMETGNTFDAIGTRQLERNE